MTFKSSLKVKAMFMNSTSTFVIHMMIHAGLNAQNVPTIFLPND